MANLTQLKVLENLDGFLLVDKPEGIAFATVVKTVKRKFNLVKVGHGGSLDAQASGLMVLMINDANKFVDRVMGADREYTGAFDFSYTTNTGDAWGNRVKENGEGVAEPDLAQFKGDVFQTEPGFAAIRREGSAAYEVVETGEHARFMGHVYRLEVRGGEGEKVREFSLKATKQILPRALALDMGATLVSLRRTAIGKFRVEDATPFDRLLEAELVDFPSLVMPIGAALR